MISTVTLEFKFANPDLKKQDVELDATPAALIPVVGDWIQPDNYGSQPVQLTKRIFRLGNQTMTVVLLSE